MDSATVYTVKVNAAALANDYDAAYRSAHGVGCHASDWQRVRDAAREAGDVRLVVQGGRRYLVNLQTGWRFENPAPGAIRVIG